MDTRQISGLFLSIAGGAIMVTGMIFYAIHFPQGSFVLGIVAYVFLLGSGILLALSRPRRRADTISGILIIVSGGILLVVSLVIIGTLFSIETTRPLALVGSCVTGVCITTAGIVFILSYKSGKSHVAGIMLLLYGAAILITNLALDPSIDLLFRVYHGSPESLSLILTAISYINLSLNSFAIVAGMLIKMDSIERPYRLRANGEAASQV